MRRDHLARSICARLYSQVCGGKKTVSLAIVFAAHGWQILFAVRSLRKGSLNLQIAVRITNDLQDRCERTELEYTDAPWTNQDIEFPIPTPVSRVREEVQACDGLWLVTPEYNSSCPGFIKNLVDWVSMPATAGAQRGSRIR